MNFSITSESQIIKLEEVIAGCSIIDTGLEESAATADKIEQAKSNLGNDSLRFGEAGGLDTSFENRLTTIADDTKKYQQANDGKTAEIISQAKRQYDEEWAEYRRYLEWEKKQREDGRGGLYEW